MMCLAVPGRVISIQGENAQVDFQGNQREVSVVLTPEANVGDWVLIHAGFAISRLDEAEAKETWKYLVEADLVDGPIDDAVDE